MAIKMSPKLQEVVTKLGIKQENILYINVLRPFFERILSEEKKVEFRDLSEWWLKKINNYDKKTLAFVSPKPVKYILFQNGMSNAEAPRLLIELVNPVQKWAKDGKGNPAEVINNNLPNETRKMTISEGKVKYPQIFKEAEYEGFKKDDEWLAFELGKIVYKEHV
ncbi:hypothetical protein [Capnocytophaga canimorsus]|uniref:hypothetical protein n=1 Tax=Capnocytophaga canimorsus TaxID=28188 RepID=UPI0037D49D1B